ncbi:MAG: class I SAM-dependent methyltransferase [Gammaproteobacteria bacterium]
MRDADTHAQRLQRFYAPQAEGYDEFRERLLHGRRELVMRLPIRPGARVVELGAGTGRTFEFFGGRIGLMERADLVDLCPALLERALQRHRGRGNVRVVEADACAYLPERPVHCVYFSYALSMIPDWRAAIDNALRILAPGGCIGAVDFHLPARDRGWRARIDRQFWARWFGHDGVRLSGEHLSYLSDRVEPLDVRELRGAVPWMPLRAPYYIFVGRVRVAAAQARVA